jgi:UDP-glucose 6-dehydrogenase
MRARENQTEWLSDLIEEKHKENTKLPIVLMGQTFKPETNLIVGSPALLLGNILKEKGINFTFHDPYVKNLNNEVLDEKSIYLISTKHDVFENLIFPNESIIIDPHRFINKSINPNSEVIYLG